MIMHTLVYRFTEPAPEVQRQAFFAEAGRVALGTGLAESFAAQPGLPGPMGDGAQVAIAQLTFRDAEHLRAYAAAPAVRQLLARWRQRLHWEIVPITHEPLHPAAAEE
ncbi:hypothetical protein Dvina_17795 [Dactylosporangium vinaceum]|uniref:Stress-response A/B barrel domain-containing protein n=1 Tax=Dactylosporangium vinaceum TaxID=53362 RepID=A0ABV5M385_9ACTN|nr:hypothetical protein [Dactylosporangium vinaceum]UAB99747.1 hypothetical protein Dvina_17795 [Dactylosporangium vinaceum]